MTIKLHWPCMLCLLYWVVHISPWQTNQTAARPRTCHRFNKSSRLQAKNTPFFRWWKNQLHQIAIFWHFIKESCAWFHGSLQLWNFGTPHAASVHPTHQTLDLATARRQHNQTTGGEVEDGGEHDDHPNARLGLAVINSMTWNSSNSCESQLIW